LSIVFPKIASRGSPYDTTCDSLQKSRIAVTLRKLTELDRALESGTSYLEAPDAEETLAAADIVARLRGNFGIPNAYTEDIDRWAKNSKFAVFGRSCPQSPASG
jgi:hypothetical protein